MNVLRPGIPNITVHPPVPNLTPMGIAHGAWIDSPGYSSYTPPAPQLVPIAYGQVSVDGKVLYLGGWKLHEVFNPQLSYENPVYAYLWEGICAGKVDIKYILIDDLGYAGTIYASSFNDGTEPDYPTLCVDTAGVALGGISKLKGVAHYIFNNWTSFDRVLTKVDGTIPKISFIVRKVFNIGLTNCDISRYFGDYLGSNPAAIILDLLINKQYGLGIPSAEIDLASFQRCADFYQTKELGLNFILSSQVSARSIIEEIQATTDCFLIINNDGKYALRVLDPLDVNAPIGYMTDDDYINFTVNRTLWEESVNELRAEINAYDPVSQLFSTRTIVARNEAVYEIRGYDVSKTIKLLGFTDPDRASSKLSELLKKESYPFHSLEIECGLDFMMTLPGDVIHISNTENGISDYFRVMRKSIEQIDDGKIKLILTQMLEKKFDSSYVSTVFTEGENHNFSLTGLENLTFPPGTAISTERSVNFPDPATSVVIWGINQENIGQLVYTADDPPTGTDDYTVITSGGGKHQIKLNATKWINNIQANVLGLLNVDTYTGSGY